MKFYVFIAALEGILLGLASGQFSSLNLQAAVESSFSAVGGSEVFENENIEVEAGSSLFANGQPPLGTNVNSPNLQISDLLKLLLNQQQNPQTPLTPQQPQNPDANGNFPMQSQQPALPGASPWNNAAPLLAANLPQQPYNYPNYPSFYNPLDYFPGIPPDYFPAVPSDYNPGVPFPYDYPLYAPDNYPGIPPDYFAGLSFPYNYPQYPSDFSPYDYHPDASFSDAYLPQVVDGKESLSELSKKPLDEKPQEEVEAITIGDSNEKNIETSLLKAALGLAEEISPTVNVENIASSEEVSPSDTRTGETKQSKGGKKKNKHPKHKRKRNKIRGNVVLQGDSEESTLDTIDATSTTWLDTIVSTAESGSPTQFSSATESKSTSESSLTNQFKSTTELVVDKCDFTAVGTCSGESKESGAATKETEVKDETTSSDGATTTLNSKSITPATTSQQSVADTVIEEEFPDSCRDDQDWWPCTPKCHNTCYNYARGDACEDHDCKPGCFCKDGLLRTDDGDCVDPDDCPSPVCGEHEEETDCISPCNNCAANCYSCQFLSCHEGCDCIDGYKRYDNGSCIQASMCPPCSSPAPEE
ncbi:hypothetical protein X975_06356, partial [Stegodyphus mimosarum]